MLCLIWKGGKCYMKIPEVKKQALGALKGKWGLAVLATFVFFLVYIVVPTIIEIPFGGFSSWTMQINHQWELI